MAQLLPHLGLKTNKDPDTHSTSVVSTYDLAHDSPRNYMVGSRLLALSVIDQPVANYMVTEAVRADSPLGYLSKGKGVRMQWDIEAKVVTGNLPVSTAYTEEGEYGFCEADMLKLCGEIAIGMAGTNDGVSTYLWLSPNYQWNLPGAEEQWIRVVPVANSARMSYDQAFGVKVRVLRLSVVTAKHYKSITQVNNRRGIAAYAGAGTITCGTGSPAVTGSGTAFLTDFLHGDFLLDNAGALIGRVDSVASNTALTLRANAASNQAGAAYRVQQRSHPSYSVPFYTLTGF